MSPTPAPWTGYDEKIRAAAAVSDVDALEMELFSRKHGVMTLALKELGGLSPEERKQRGQEMNVAKQALEEAIALRRSELQSGALQRLATDDPLDVTLTAPQAERGHLHPITEFIDRIGEVFGRMGFDVAVGPEVEGEAYNFDLLNFQPDHPARDAHDTFWIEGGDRTLLRTHTSPVQIRYMQTHTPPFRMVCPGKTYRKDADATHSPMFHQCEGLMIGKDVSLAHMKGVMTAAIRELISDDLVFRFRTSYFPFVEPGLEVDMKWRGQGESREGKWMEVAGCGMVHANVLRNCGIDPDEWQGFAFGFGVERLLMIKHAIPDLRSFYEGDLRFLRQF